VGKTQGIRARQRQQTQERILAAARQLFAQVGYERATIRSIASAAEADPGLVMRYFGSKKELFSRVANMSSEDGMTGSPEQVTEYLLTSLAAKLTQEPAATLAMLRSMLTHPDAADEVRGAANRHEHQLAAAIPAEDAAARAGVIGAITLGTLIARHLLQLNGLTAASPAQITALLRPCLRSLIQGQADESGRAPDGSAPDGSAHGVQRG
jgi:AcrR family transcriptional regulator